MAKKKTVKGFLEESGEKLKKRSVETVKQTFTTLSKDVIGQLTGKEMKQDVPNSTHIDESIREQMGKNFAEQDNDELEAVREKLAGPNQPDALKEQLAQQQLQYVRKEEQRAREQLREEEQERKRKQEEEEEQRRAEEEQRQQAVQIDAPTGKQARGSAFSRKKKPQQNIENKPAQGKQ